MGLGLLVDVRFQVLFHSPLGVLFTFPSRYSSLSVAEEYLALEGGPSGFPRGFTCPAVLGCPTASRTSFAYRIVTFCDGPFQTPSARSSFRLAIRASPVGSHNPAATTVTPLHDSGLGSSRFARRYSGNRFFFPLLGVLRCFSSPGSLQIAYVFSDR